MLRKVIRRKSQVVGDQPWAVRLPESADCTGGPESMANPKVGGIRYGEAPQPGSDAELRLRRAIKRQGFVIAPELVEQSAINHCASAGRNRNRMESTPAIIAPPGHPH